MLTDKNTPKVNPCSKKKAYPSVEDANLALKKMGVLGMEGYHCVFCGLAHINYRKD